MAGLTQNIKIYWIVIIIAVLAAASYWFLNKFYPAQVGEWSSDDKKIFDENYVPASGWFASPSGGERSFFWTSLDFPGKQKVCLDVYSKSKFSQNTNLGISLVQAPKAYLYPKAGTLSDLFPQMTPAQAEERIRQEKPYFIGHLQNSIEREGKDIFFLGENEKFLIPTKGIFTKHFPAKELPALSENISPLPYANVLVSLPEGTLLSDGKGVFVMSQGQLFLIRSPEVFEAMGYKWEGVGQMDNYEKSFNPYLSGNLIDFGSANPNGTILKNNQDLFLVWEEKLYSLTPDELSQYFSNQPIVEVAEKNLSGNCQTSEGSDKVTCCVANVDTRLNPPNYNPFLNTVSWDLNKIVKQNDVEKIDWQAKINLDKDNTLRRLGSLKNFILYGLGILK